jgi:hypothetical protein
MSRRSSLGVTVLALVALHSLSLIGLVALELAAIDRLDNRSEHLDALEVLSTLEKELEAGRIRAEEKIFNETEAFTFGELIELWQPDATRCSEDFFMQVQHKLYFVHGSLFSYVNVALQRRQDFCFSLLGQQIEEKCGSALSESTRRHFESFKKHLDIGDIFKYPNEAINKLRQIIESPENANQFDIAKGYLRACEDVIERCASIKPIRANYLRSAFTPSTNHWPHVRFYDFCRQLFDFDFADQIDMAVKDSASEIKYFAERQDRNQAQSLRGPNAATMSTETAESDLEHEQSLAEAAVRYAADWAKGQWIKARRDEDGSMCTYALSFPSENSVPATVEDGLDNLRRTCSTKLSLVRNFLWMHKHDLLGPAHGDIHKPTTERKLRFLKACEHLVKLRNEKIIEKGGQRKLDKKRAAKLFGLSRPK